MICEKCGKNNPTGTQKCNFCGEKMPNVANGNGFEDILSYEGPAPVNGGGAEANGTTLKEGYSEETMQKLIKKSDKIIDHTQKNAILSLIAIVISVVILIISIANIWSISKINDSDNTDPRKTNASDGRSGSPDNPPTPESIKKDLEMYKGTLKDEQDADEIEEMIDIIDRIINSKKTKSQEASEKDEKDLKVFLDKLNIDEGIIGKIENESEIENEEYDKIHKDVYDAVIEYASINENYNGEYEKKRNFLNDVNVYEEIVLQAGESYNDKQKKALEAVYKAVDAARKDLGIK